jgi:alkylhydroperoxidase/carboxymuconolactone decarboxylase family protein YurZ
MFSGEEFENMDKNKKNNTMKKIVQTAGRTQLGEFAPEFAHLNDDILFGEVWSRNDLLSLRDRSLVTITSLISQGITDNSLKYHLQSAKNNGITRTEAAEIITHIAFYAGWPKAWAAFNLAKEVWNEDVKGEDAKSAFQREMIFPIGEPNTAYAKYFKGDSYLAQISDSQIPFFNVTFEPGCRNNWHTHRHKGRRANAGRRSRTRLVSGRRQACAGNPPRHSHPYSSQREALAWCRKRQLVCPPCL